MIRATYTVKEAFLTIQGEGAWSGHRAVFVRFAGCNVWSGLERDREAHSVKGGCALWCDTDFRGTDGKNGGVYSAADLVERVVSLWTESLPPTAPPPVAVFTGGEPSLQLDARLVDAMKAAGVRVHVETNGTKLLPSAVDWVTLSPKPPAEVVAQRYDEVKVVYPFCDPAAYAKHAPLRFLQPLDVPGRGPTTREAVAYVLEHPEWRLSLQTHKLIGVP
jgi:7-carboxy-7-deazaguanine synthase